MLTRVLLYLISIAILDVSILTFPLSLIRFINLKLLILGSVVRYHCGTVSPHPTNLVLQEEMDHSTCKTQNTASGKKGNQLKLPSSIQLII